MFIRSKRVGNKDYWYVVESYRDGPKVRQRNVYYLGSHVTVASALTELRDRIARCQAEHAQLLKQQLNSRHTQPTRNVRRVLDELRHLNAQRVQLEALQYQVD